MKLQMDTEFKPLLIVNVPSGLTPSSSIASAPFCVCVCPMCTYALKCVCVLRVCAKAVGEEVTEILHKTKQPSTCLTPTISKKMGTI